MVKCYVHILLDHFTLYLNDYCIVTCIEGSVRLKNPDAPTESQLPAYDLIKDQVSRGIVEVCVDESYSTILMDSFWNDDDAAVICRQMGFSSYGLLFVFD